MKTDELLTAINQGLGIDEEEGRKEEAEEELGCVEEEEEDEDLGGWKVGGDMSGPLSGDRSTEIGTLERRNTKDLSPEVFREGKWQYVPPPRLIKSASAGFYGF